MAKTASDLIEVTRVMLEASNAKEKTNLPTEAELKEGWHGVTLGFVSHDYAPIPASDMGLEENDILELVRSFHIADHFREANGW